MHFVYINWLQLTEGYGMLYLHVDIIRSILDIAIWLYWSQILYSRTPPTPNDTVTSERSTDRKHIYSFHYLAHTSSLIDCPRSINLWSLPQNCVELFKKNDPYNYINMFQLEKKFSQCYPKLDVSKLERFWFIFQCHQSVLCQKH